MLRNILTGMAVVALCAGATAQNTASYHSKANTPVKYLGEYQMASGEWSLASRAGSRVLYNCTTWGNYYSTVGNSGTTVADQLWIDEGVIADSNGSNVDQVNGFDFAYCSSDLDPTGNSGSIGIYFYDDYTPCTTPPAATCAYVITGLPLGSNGNTACWGVGIDLEGGSECTTDAAALFQTTDAGVSDRSFGWAFGSNPGMSGMNDTGSIMDLPCATPVQSAGCGSGNQNFFWWEDPAGAWNGCYWFGGIPYASFSMKMYAPGSGTANYGYGNGITLSCDTYAQGGNSTFSSVGHSPSNTITLAVSQSTWDLSFAGQTILVQYPFMATLPMDAATGTVSVTIPTGVPDPVYCMVIECAGAFNPGNFANASNGVALMN